MRNGWKPSKRYGLAFKGLYGQLTLGEQLELGKKRAQAVPDCPFEEEEHFKCAAWLRRFEIPHHHSPNGEKREPHVGAKLKAMGTSAGFPDFIIPVARKGFHSLYVELKRQYGGVLSHPQKYWRDLLLQEGHQWYMARGYDDFVQFVENYLR